MTVVIDTNILVSALRSGTGPSHAIVASIPSTKFKSAISVPLYNEYMDVLHRPGLIPQQYTAEDKTQLCDYITEHSVRQEIYFLWRPLLPDAKDDMILEVAVAAGARYIVTRNVRDFGPARSFGVEAVKPAEFIKLIGGLP